MWPARHFSYEGPISVRADGISRTEIHSDAGRRPPPRRPAGPISADDLGIRQRQQGTAATEIDERGK
jgi:hypothetical protein